MTTAGSGCIPTDVKVLGISVEGLMKTFGLTLEKSVHLREEKGLEIDKNDLLLDPSRMLPPPRISGRLRAVQLEPDRLVQLFGPPDSLGPRDLLRWSDHPAPNYMYYHGATVRLGRLTMTPTDLLIVDADPSNPFEFSLVHYHDAAGGGVPPDHPGGWPGGDDAGLLSDPSPYR